MKLPWKIYHSGKFIDSGFVEAKDEREGMTKVLEMPHKKVVDENCYTVTVGEMVTSSFGDEFKRTGSIASSGAITELEPPKGGYLFQEECKKVLKDTPCTIRPHSSCDHKNMNGDAWHPVTGEKHAQCQDCGYISPKGTGQFKKPFYVDPNYDPPCINGHEWERINLRGDRVCRTCGERDRNVGVLTSLKPGEYVVPQDLFRPKSNKDLLMSTFGPRLYGKVRDALMSRGYRITDVRSVNYDQIDQNYTIQGEFEDENGCRMGWQYRISDLQLRHMP